MKWPTKSWAVHVAAVAVAAAVEARHSLDGASLNAKLDSCMVMGDISGTTSDNMQFIRSWLASVRSMFCLPVPGNQTGGGWLTILLP